MKYNFKKLLLTFAFITMPYLVHGASQTYIASTTTYNPYTINIATVQVGTGIVIPDGTVSLPAIRFANDVGVGITRPNTTSIGFVTNGSTRVFINGTGQAISTYGGTACLPGWTFGLDAGSGMFLSVSDQLSFSAGCSTGIVVDQHDYPTPLDKTLANIYHVYGGSSTVPSRLTEVDFGIWTATVTTTNNQVGQCNQYHCKILVEGHNSALTAAFTDEIEMSFYGTTPFVVSSNDDIGTANLRTYTGGAGSTGILNLKMDGGTYQIQSWHTQLGGK